MNLPEFKKLKEVYDNFSKVDKGKIEHRKAFNRALNKMKEMIEVESVRLGGEMMIDILKRLNKDELSMDTIESIANNKLIKDKSFKEAQDVLVKNIKWSRLH